MAANARARGGWHIDSGDLIGRRTKSVLLSFIFCMYVGEVLGVSAGVPIGMGLSTRMDRGRWCWSLWSTVFLGWLEINLLGDEGCPTDAS